ncbi:MAG: hypothetical protein ACKPB8_19580, partial [Alphaproteobacteria bacterium]
MVRFVPFDPLGGSGGDGAGQARALPRGAISGQAGAKISPTGAPMSPIDAIRRHQAELTAFRRDLHAHP